MADTPALYTTSQLRASDAPETISVKQAAHLLGVCEATAKRLIDNGTLPAIRLSERVNRIPTRAILRMFDAAMPEGTEAEVEVR